MLVQVPPSHYNDLRYNTKERFYSYWCQISEVAGLDPSNVLEIGIGNGVVSGFLRRSGFEVTTVDLDIDLKPSVAATVLDLPFRGEVFDVVACFEVLEHIPYRHFRGALSEICRVCKSHVVLSLPESNRAKRFGFSIPGIAHVQAVVFSNVAKRVNHDPDGQHFWEIGGKGHSLKDVVHEITQSGLIVERSCRMPEDVYHRYFVGIKRNRKSNVNQRESETSSSSTQVLR